MCSFNVVNFQDAVVFPTNQKKSVFVKIHILFFTLVTATFGISNHKMLGALPVLKSSVMLCSIIIQIWCQSVFDLENLLLSCHTTIMTGLGINGETGTWHPDYDKARTSFLTM